MERPIIKYGFYLTNPYTDIVVQGCIVRYFPIQAFDFIIILYLHIIITIACTVMLHGSLLIYIIHNMGKCTCLLALSIVGCISVVVAYILY